MLSYCVRPPDQRLHCLVLWCWHQGPLVRWTAIYHQHTMPRGRVGGVSRTQHYSSFLSTCMYLAIVYLKASSYHDLVGRWICMYSRMWLGFLSLNKSQRCLLLIFWTPINIEFWWLNKSFRDRLRDEKWWYLLGNSVVDCSYYNCSSIKSSVHKRSHSRTQLRDKQQQQLFTTLQQ